MQSDNTDQRPGSELSLLQEKIKEAELYRSQCLFAEAREIYTELLAQLESLCTGATEAEASAALARRRDYLQKQLAKLDREEAEFLGQPSEAGPAKPAPAPEGDAVARFNRGLALLDIGLFAEAIQEFEKAAALEYQPLECCLHIGRAYIQLGQPREGIRVLEESYRLPHLSAGDRNRLLEQMAAGYQAAGDNNKALQLYRLLAEHEPHHPAAAGKIQALLEQSQRYHFNLARLHLKNRQFLKAVEQLRLLRLHYEAPVEKLLPLYERILQDDPENVEAMKNLAEICAARDELLQAAQYLEKIQELQPREGWSQQQLTAVYRQILSRNPGAAEVRLRLAGHLLRSGDYDNGINEYLELLLEEGPLKMTALVHLGRALLAQQDYDRILELLGDALAWVDGLEPGPQLVEYYHLLGTAAEKKYLYDQARSCFQRAAAIDPSHEAIRAKLELQSRGPLVSRGKALLHLGVDEQLQYEIKEDLGQDEIHQIFKVSQLPVGSIRIAKTLLPHLAAAARVKEFVLSWAYQQATMENRNIARLVDVAEAQGQYFLVMEDYEMTLEDLLKEKQRLPVPEGVRLARALLNGLAYAHSHRGTDDTLRKIFHLGLNPRRVLLRGDVAAAKIADFGLMFLLDTILGWAPTYQQRSAFELAYMAPEQFDRPPSRMPDKMKQAADLYAFGLLFYQILTGRLPFGGPKPEDFKKQHNEKYPVPPRVFVSSIPAKLDEAILRCLGKDPKRRWRTPTELDLALEKIDLPC